MKIERRVVDKEIGIIQITTSDERWYFVGEKYLPSVTWILDVGFPKSIGFYKWLAGKGWDEAEGLKEAAGNKGSKVHQAINMLCKGNTIKHDDLFTNNKTGAEEELTVEEYEAVMSFCSWYNSLASIKIKSTEQTVVHPESMYAGTTDLIVEIDDVEWLIDLKTSQNIYKTHEMQVSAYSRCMKGWETRKLAILQVGYYRNKNRYKFTPVDDCYSLFENTYQIWKAETDGIVPKQKDYPMELKLKQEVK